MKFGTKIHAAIPAQNIKGIKNFNVEEYPALSQIGIHISGEIIQKMSKAMDSIQPPVTTPSISTPVQFLQSWMRGVVWILTQARKIDEAIGINIVGSYSDEEVVQTILERLGVAQPYTGYQNVPLSNFNLNYAKSTIVRFESGMFVENLEAERASKVNVSADNAKREACIQELEIARNNVGWSGFNDGLGLTYGLLNAPDLPAYQTVANGDNGTPEWSTKSMLNICADLRVAASQLQNQSGDNVDPTIVPCTLLVPTNAVNFLSTQSDFGYSVKNYVRDNYPFWRVVSAPQLNAANGGAGVFYLFADKNVSGQDISTDDGATFAQNVQTKFLVNGVEKQAKGYLEDYLNATAGVMCKRPFLVTRWTGIS